MSENVTNLSEADLVELIAKASKELELKRQSKKKDTINRIKELASSIGVYVEISEAEKKSMPRRGSSVPIKYRDPDNPKHAWSGRGMKPRWLAALLEQGRSLEEFHV